MSRLKGFFLTIGGIFLALGAFALLLWRQFREGRKVGSIEGAFEAKEKEIDKMDRDELHDELTRKRPKP